MLPLHTFPSHVHSFQSVLNISHDRDMHLQLTVTLLIPYIHIWDLVVTFLESKVLTGQFLTSKWRSPKGAQRPSV